MKKNNNNEFSKFEDLVGIVKKLRSPDGCDWDKAQTRNSLIPYFIEEVYELIESIDKKDLTNIREELGISDSLIRLSVGIEDSEDLISAFDKALKLI